MVRLIHHAFDLGVTFFDTAECYGPYVNELLAGKALKPIRDKVVIATKCGIQIQNGVQKLDARPEVIRRSIEGSLLRLQTDYIDLYYLHRVDPKVLIEEVAWVMQDLMSQGKIRGWGLLHDILKYPPNDINFDPPRGGVVRYFYNDEKVEDHGFRCSSQRRFQNHDYQRMPSSCAATCS